MQPKFIESSFCNEIGHLLYLELEVKKIRESSYNPTWEFSEISEILRKPSKLADADKYSVCSHYNYFKKSFMLETFWLAIGYG